MKRYYVKWLALAVLPLGFGCQGTVQDRLGLSNRAPDEFQVVRRAPLVVPPDYGLRPPNEAAAAAGNRQSAAAKTALTGTTDQVLANASAGERALLASVAVEKTPNIRTLLVEDAGSIKQLDESQFLTILDWQRPIFEGDQALDPEQAAADIQASGVAAKVVTRRTDGSKETEEQ